MLRHLYVAGRKARSVLSSTVTRQVLRRAAIETLEERRLLSISLGTPLITSVSGDTFGQMVPVKNLAADNATDLLVSVTASGAGSLTRELLANPGHAFDIGNPVGQPGLTDLAPIASADFNGDGFPDFVQSFESADNTAGFISVSQNNGDGTFFRPQNPLPVSNHPTALAICDLNNDHIPDIINSNNADRPSISIYLGDGSGRFNPAAGFYTDQLVNTIVPGDFNNDGNIDLATPQGIFYGLGDGTFRTPVAYPAGAGSQNIVAADFNNDGKLDLALAGGADQPNQPAVITILLNNGDKTFTASTVNVGAGLTGIVGMATGSLETDTFSDLLVTLGAGGGTHANQLAVLPSNADGTFGSALFFNTGVNAGPVVVAPFNGGVRNDVAVLDQNNASVSLLDNISTLNAQVSLTSSNLNSVQGEVVQLTATCVGGQGTVPTGTVTFLDGQNPIGTINVLPNGLAPLITTQLAPGAHTITAVYSGDSNYQTQTSTAITQNVADATTVNTAAVDVQVGQLVLPAVAVPGDKGKITLVLTNHGTQPVSGRLSTQLFASADGANDQNSILVGSIIGKSIKLLPGRSTKLTAKVVLPVTTPADTYQIIAQLSAGAGIAAGVLSSGFGPSNSFQVVDEFGTVGGRAKVKLVQQIQGGPLITYSLSGPGTGTVTGGNATLTLDNTTAATKVQIAQKGGNGIATIGTITSNGSLGSLGSSKMTIGTALNITGNVGQLTLGNVSGAKIAISGNGVMKATFGNVANTNMATGGTFTTLKMNSWTGATIIAAHAIGTLSSKGEFDAGLSLHGAGLDLKSATFKGSNGGLWGIAGNVGKVNNTGAWSNGGILAGTDFGADDARGGGDDTFGAAVISSLSVKGAVNVSIFAAGLNPVDGQYLNGDDTVAPGSSIAAIKIGGLMGPESRIVSHKLPPKVKIGPVTVLTANDPRFQTD